MGAECARSEGCPGACVHRWRQEVDTRVPRRSRTGPLDALPKFLANAHMRHGYCTAELIIWYVMKQLTLPPDMSEVTASMRAKGRYRRARTKAPTAKGLQGTCVSRAVTFVDLMVAISATTALRITVDVNLVLWRGAAVERASWSMGDQWQEYAWEGEEYEASKGKKGNGKTSKSKGKSKGKETPWSTKPTPEWTTWSHSHGLTGLHGMHHCCASEKVTGVQDWQVGRQIVLYGHDAWKCEEGHLALWAYRRVIPWTDKNITLTFSAAHQPSSNGIARNAKK